MVRERLRAQHRPVAPRFLHHHHFLELFAPLARAQGEMMAVAFLDTDGRLLGLRHCRSASLVAIEVPLRAIAADALALDAQQIVMAHNHPSGDPEPSYDDLFATRRIAVALDALGIRLIDHIVLAGSVATSLRARGLL